MHFFLTSGLRSSPASRLLLFKRLQSTTTSQNAKTLFTYGKGGHYFLDKIDPAESVRSFLEILSYNYIAFVILIEIFKNFDC